jgi:peptidoglycan/xylan/chitin deacetylase (PgdA/CDA1 family)
MRQGITAIGSRLDARIPSVKRALSRGLTVFVFHDVTDSPSNFQRDTGTYTPTHLFIEQVEWVRDRFAVVSPAALPQLGGKAPLPGNAALITFDDAWAGVFRTALPWLESVEVPSICFLNMATVEGDPDLGAARIYLRNRCGTEWPKVDPEAGARLLSEVRSRFRADPEFARYQGQTATAADLERADTELVWFGSHLYHHWDVRMITRDLYAQSLRLNLEALRPYANALPALATPHGYSGSDDSWTIPMARELGHRVVFIGTGRQNPNGDRYVLDRLALPSGPSNACDWWHSTHRGRLLGSLIG